MRLEKIRFYNINSLKGEHSISFDEGVIADAGLFAITGPTGSGKSTILDVITLALFNYVPRLGKISKTTIEKMGSVVTHFTDEAWAEVEYTSQNNRYLSKWSISKNRNGNYRDYDMDLVHLPEGKSEGLKKSDIPARNTEIIGLSYDQFLKSILLSQGEFSKFLKANKDERSRLLEEITGTHIYRSIGKSAFEKTKDKKMAIDSLRSRMDMIPVMEEEKVLEKEKAIEEFKHTIDRHEQEITRIESLLQFANLQSQIAQRESLIKEKSDSWNNLKEQSKADLQKMSAHQEAKRFENYIQELESSHLLERRLDKEIQQSMLDLKTTKEQKSAQIEALQNLVQSEVSASNFYRKMHDFEKEIIEFDTQLHQLKAQGQQLRHRIHTSCSEAPFSIARKLSAKIPAQEAIQIIDDRIKLLPNTQGLRQTDIQQAWTEKQEKKSIVSDYIRIYERSENFRNQIKEERLKSEQVVKQITASKDQWNLLKEEEGRLQSTILEKQEILEKAKNEASLEQYRSLLKDGEPCPLCGSLDHPYAEHKKLAEIGLLSLEIDALQNTLKKNQSALTQAQTNQLQFESSLHIIQTQIEKDTQEWKEHEAQRILKTKQHPWILNIADEGWSAWIHQQEEESKKLKQQLESIEENRFLHQQREEFISLSEVTRNYQLKEEARLQRFKGSDVTEQTNLLQNQFTRAHETIEQLIKNQQENEVEKQQLKTKIEELRRQLKPLQNNYQLTTPESCRQLLLPIEQFNRISKTIENIQHIETEIKTLTEENDKLRQELEKLANASSSNSLKEIDQLDSNVLRIQKENHQGSLSTLQNEQGAIQNQLDTNQKERLRKQSMQKEFDQLEQENKSWILLNQLIGDAKGKKFSNYAQDLTLIHLLIGANARLESLTDRYFLSFRPDEDDLIVIDKYQGDTERAVRTLSGGESFLISLALALSLSDFASQKVRLESLFIDEGFGTLDHETLDVAMSTLEKLQHDSGKRIGIISHVASLKERIHTQIKVQKNAQGYSKLEIVQA